MIKNSRISFVFAVLILIVASVLRFNELTSLPPGLNDQEIIDVRLAENARQGGITVFYNLDGEGREGLYPTMLAISTVFTGEGIIAYRMLSIWLGMIAVALIFALGKRLYGDTAGLVAMALMAFSFWPVLMSRLAGREMLLLILVIVVLLALALALPVYGRRRGTRTLTTGFGLLGIFVGLGFYVHPAGLIVALMALLSIIYMLRSRYRLSVRTMTFIGFSVLVTMIVVTPYMTSALRQPELGAVTRLVGGALGAEQPILERIVNGLLGLGIRGDLDPTYNLPGRPLFDPISAALIVVGVVIAIRKWRKPRFALPLIGLVLLGPLALLTPGSPSFLAYSAVLPILALFFGVGALAVIRWFPYQHVATVGIATLLVANLVWTYNTLFIQWQHLPDVQQVYHGETASLARYVDQTARDIPTVVCTTTRTGALPQRDLPASYLLLLMMNGSNEDLRLADCDTGLVMVNGGEDQQVILSNPEVLDTTNPLIQEWFSYGEALDVSGTAENAVLSLDVSDPLADTIGRFTTTAPYRFPPEAAQGDNEGHPPPVRLTNNLTFLGYEDLRTEFAPGDVVTVVTYWRVDGDLPPDLLLFTHIQDDPGASPVAQRGDVISVVPAQLVNRDVFMQVTYIELPETIPEGSYLVSTGAYQSLDGARLGVLDETDQQRGDRLILFNIRVGT